MDTKKDYDYASELVKLAQSGKIPSSIIVEDKDTEQALNIALDVAAALMCDSDKEKPCGECSGCVKVKSLSHTDMKIFKPEKPSDSLKIECIRKIREDAYVAPLEANCKVYIIVGADALTVQAQNAFIKILEEPPKNVVFMLLCRSSSSLLGTIRSRCRKYSKNRDESLALKKDLHELADKIADSACKKHYCDVLKYTAEIPGERAYLKLLMESVLERILKLFSCGETDSSITYSEVIGVADSVKNLIKIVDNNINLNLIKCLFAAYLQFQVGGENETIRC